MRLFYILWICNTLHWSCSTQLSIRDEVLREKTGWIEPGRGEKLQSEAEAEDGQLPPCEEPADIAELRKNLRSSERGLSGCKEKLTVYELQAKLNDNWTLNPDFVYLKKLVNAVLNRFEGGSLGRKGAPSQLRLSLSEKQRREIKDSMTNLDKISAAKLVENMQNIINEAQITYDRVETHSNFRQLYIDLCVILGEIDLFTAIQISIVVCAIIFVYIAATCRSKLVTLSYLLVFGTWISYFWHWQNMLRKSQANRHILSQKNPCEDSRSFYNPLRYFGTNSDECEKYLRKMFTPMFWEFTPLEVLVDMVATYTSNVVSVLIINIMSAVGDAIREFADKQSWFSIVPAFAVLLMVLLTVLFKLSGCGLSLFYGAMRIAPPAEPARGTIERPQAPLIHESLNTSLESRRCSSSRQVGWKEDHRSKKKKRRHKYSIGLDNDSDNYLTAAEL